jgi:hypothetical protein
MIDLLNFLPIIFIMIIIGLVLRVLPDYIKFAEVE